MFSHGQCFILGFYLLNITTNYKPFTKHSNGLNGFVCDVANWQSHPMNESVDLLEIPTGFNGLDSIASLFSRIKHIVCAVVLNSLANFFFRSNFALHSIQDEDVE